MADSKHLLKEARKYIDEKKYKKAELCCRKVLQNNANNYLALVFLGKSLEESHEALLTFHKAIESKPDKTLAWKGLATYFENRDDDLSKFKLLSIYGHLLNMKIKEEKASNILVKIGELGLIRRDARSINILLYYLDRNPNVKLFKIAESQLLKLLVSDIITKKEVTLRIIEYLSRRILEGSNESMCLVLGLIILQNHRLDKALQTLTNLVFFDSNIMLRKWLCKYLCIHFLKHERFCGVDMYNYREKIIHCIERFMYARLLVSMICYDKGLYLEAYDICLTITNLTKINVIVATHLIKCTVKLRKWYFTEKIARQCILLRNQINFTIVMKKYLFTSLAEQKKWPQAIEIGESIPSKNMLMKHRATLAQCYVENNQPFNEILKTLEETEYFVQIQALSLMKQGRFTDVISLLLIEPLSSVNCFYIAKAYWELKNYNLCFMHLSKGVQVDPNSADINNLLGIYHQDFMNNMVQAREYFETAHRLNSSDPDIIRNLSDFYIKAQLKKENYYLLKTASNEGSDQTWIKIRLGEHFTSCGMWDSAISLYVDIIKDDNNNVEAHDKLADAYYNKGDYLSAMEIYLKVVDLNPNNRAHALSKIGTIHIMSKKNIEALTAFEEALEIDPEYELAIKGITVTWMKIAKENADNRVYHIARDAAQTSINYLITALTRPGRINYYWRLLACSVLFITKLPDGCIFVNINFDDDEIGNLGTLYVKRNIYRFAYYCFWRGQSTLPAHYERRLALEIAEEITEEEESEDIFRYCSPPDLGLTYTQWVNIYLREYSPFEI